MPNCRMEDGGPVNHCMDHVPAGMVAVVEYLLKVHSTRIEPIALFRLNTERDYENIEFERKRGMATSKAR